MPISADFSPVVRRGASWKSPVLFGFVVFLLTSLTVNLWLRIRYPEKPAAPEQATAIIDQRPSVAPLPSSMIKPPSSVSAKAVSAIRDQITSLASLRQALSELDKGQSRDIEAETQKLRESLKVTLEDSPMDQKCLRLSLLWPDSREAAKILKTLGENYANRYRSHLGDAFDRDDTEARRASDAAAKAYWNAVAQLEFFESCRACQSNSVEKPLPKAPAPAPVSPLRSEVPAKKTPVVENRQNSQGVENPDWTNMHLKLNALRHKEMDLLDKRLPTHPEVQFVHAQIYEYEAQLAKIPRWISNQPPKEAVLPSESERIEPTVPNQEADSTLADVPGRGRPGSLGSQDSTIPDAKTSRMTDSINAEIVAILEDRVEAAAGDYYRALVRERTMLEGRELPPKIAVRVFVPKTIAVSPQSKLPVAWLAGAAMAVGMCLISTGNAIQLPISSVAELNRITNAPIIGVVPSYNPSVNPASIKRKRLLLRLFCFLAGLAVVGFCIHGLVRWM
jgi:hypothetical protein